MTTVFACETAQNLGYADAMTLLDPRLPTRDDGGGESPLDGSLHKHVYETLRYRFATGAVTPDSTFSTRSLAAELEVSQMPVREALSRLAAEGAIEIRSKRRLAIPPMTRERFEDLLSCRLLLEPAAAAQAVGHVDAARMRQLRKIDAHMDAAMAGGDVATYMASNYAFHFALYEASGRPTMIRLIETLWLQFGPFMRVVYGRLGTAGLVDQHTLALDAIATGDAEGLSQAIRADIADGMALIVKDIWKQ